MKLLNIHGWQGLIGFIWSLPITIPVFLFYMLPMIITKQYIYKRRDGFLLEFQVSKDSWADKKLWKHRAGLCLGMFNIYDRYYINNEQTIEHEKRHSRQVFTFSIFQPIIYISHVLYIYWFQKEKHPYLDCIWERDARKAAGQQVDIPKEKWYWGSKRWIWW